MGHLLKPQYYAVDPKTGQKVRRKTKNWYIQIKIDGRWKREPAYSDKQSSMAMMLRREAEIAAGIENPDLRYGRHNARPIAEHLEEFRKDLANRGNSPDHVRTTFNRAAWVCTTGGITGISDITPARVNTATAKLIENGKSLSSRNHYITAIKAFAAWLAGEKRIAENAIESMEKKSTDGFETFVRRPLTEDEFAKLLKSSTKGQSWDGISAADRTALYILAAFTGYRRSELAALTRESFDFGDSPTVALPATVAKGKRRERMPISDSVAAYLKSFLSRKPHGVPIWPVGDIRTAQMTQADLQAADIAAVTPGLPGEPPIVVDFHSLRGTFITRLARAGVAPKLAQSLARHSTIDLTMNVYAKMTADERLAAVRTLPDLTHGLTQGLTHKPAASSLAGKARDGSGVSTARPTKPRNPGKTGTKKPHGA